MSGPPACFPLRPHVTYHPCGGQDPATPLPLTWLLRPAFIKWIFLQTTWQGLDIKYGDV